MGTLDDALSRSRRPHEPHEPLIDVIEGSGSYRVVVLLPGVEAKDVTVKRLPGSLKVEVVRGGTTFVKEIPCGARPERISIVSSKENNSVVELVFAKGGKRR